MAATCGAAGGTRRLGWRRLGRRLAGVNGMGERGHALLRPHPSTAAAHHWRVVNVQAVEPLLYEGRHIRQSGPFTARGRSRRREERAGRDGSTVLAGAPATPRLCWASAPPRSPHRQAAPSAAVAARGAARWAFGRSVGAAALGAALLGAGPETVGIAPPAAQPRLLCCRPS